MAWPDALPRRGLYLITPDTTDSLRLFSQCLRVLPARPALLQYRNKSTDPALRLAQAQTLTTRTTRDDTKTAIATSDSTAGNIWKISIPFSSVALPGKRIRAKA